VHRYVWRELVRNPRRTLASLVGVALAPIVTAVLVPLDQATWAGVALALGGSALVTVAHADNIERLRGGTERRLSTRSRGVSVPSAPRTL